MYLFVYMCMLSLNDEHAFAVWVVGIFVAISKPLRTNCMYVCICVYICSLSLNDKYAFAGWVMETLVAISKPLRMSCMYVCVYVYMWYVAE
jgi:hypothetical protein